MSNKYDEFIRLMGEAPESQMDAILAKECKEFDYVNGDRVRFLRDLRDKCVFTGSSEFCVLAITVMLSKEPEETMEESDLRHAELDLWVQGDRKCSAPS
jgi:hypothetical protein